MKLEVIGLQPDQPVPEEFCFMIPDPQEKAVIGPNVSPELRWSDLPEGTRSLVVILEDPDAPTEPENVNKEGTTLSKEMPRTSFHHWVLVDIPPDRQGIPKRAESEGVINGGKELGPQSYGLRGANDFTKWFAGNPDMEGVYGGYDGPAPPFNDELVHHYHYRLFALDVESLGLSGEFDAAAVKAAMDGHVIAQAEVMGTCTLNPALR